MRIILANENGIVKVYKFFPLGGSVPTGIRLEPGESIMLEVKPGEVNERIRW